MLFHVSPRKMEQHEEIRLEMTEQTKRLTAAASFAAEDAERSKCEIAKVERGAPPGGRNVPHSAGVRMINLCETTRSRVGDRPIDGPLLDAWFELNYRLQEEAIDTQINRSFIEQWIMRLWTIVSPRPQCFWFFLARINELALLCTSKYVDSCEFAAADELLVKPSCLLLSVERGRPISGKGDIRPASVSLHPAVFQDEGGRAGGARERILAQRKVGPLLPCLYNLLKGSGYMTEDYLLSVSRRTEKITQLAGMLAGLGMGKAEDLSTRLSSMDFHQRRDFRSRVCLFDRKTFNELGRALHLFMQFGNVDDKYVGKYVRG